MQKGPFVQGTEIIVRELDDRFVPTGRTFTGRIDDNTGRFTVRGTLNYPYVELSANGFYFNEVSGSLSAATLSLLALADLRDSTTVNVNLLTHLEYGRVLALIDSGLDFRAAKAQAQAEVLAMFNLADDTIANSEKLDIAQDGNGNAILLAVSVLVQSNKSEAQLTELLSSLSNDLAADGVLNSSTSRQTLLDAVEYVKPQRAAIRANIVNRYASLGVDTTVPPFEEYLFALDKTAPAVISTWPQEADDLEVHGVVITFNDLMEHDTLTLNSIILLDQADDPVTGHVDATDVQIRTIASFTPDTPLAPGPYRIVVETGAQDYAGNGAVAPVAINFIHTPISQLSAINSGPTRLDSSTLLTASVPGGSDAISYHWSLGDGSSATGSEVSHLYPTVGNYTATVTATNAVSEVVSSTVVTVIDRAIEGFQADNSGLTRLASSTTFTATILDGSNVTYTWNFGDGAEASGSQVAYTYAAVGGYTTTVTATNGVSEVTASTVVTVIDRAIENLQAENSGPTRLGSSTTFTATILDGSNVVYTWDFGSGPEAGGSVVGRTYIALGDHTATVTATNGVSEVTASTVVTVIDRAIEGLQAENSGPTRLASATTFTATIVDGSNVTYTWDFGDGVETNGPAVTHTYASVGDYTVIVTATNGVSEVVASTVATIIDRAITGLQADSSGPTRLNDSIAFTATILGGSNVGYIWNFGDGLEGSGPAVTHTYASVGDYTATVTAINGVSQTTASTAVSVIDREISGLQASNSGPTWINNSTTFTATILDGSNTNYIWDFGDGSTGNGAQIGHTYTALGSYTATVTATNSLSQNVTTTIVSVTDRGIIDLQILTTEPTWLSRSTAFTATIQDGSDVTYTWDFGDGIEGNGPAVGHIYDQIGNYTATVTATNSVSQVVATSTVRVVVFAQITAGYYHTCALTTAGGVKCWGYNSEGELGNGTRVSKSTPVDVVGLDSGITTIAAGWYHTCALTIAGGVKCWGANYDGQLGDGTTQNRRLTPVDVVGMDNGVADITAGRVHTCALMNSGAVKCWGNNYTGQLGDGTKVSKSSPVDVVGLGSGVVAFDAGYLHTCALTTGGGVKCWGNNDAGQLGDGTMVSKSNPVYVVGLSSGVAAITTGEYHTCALTNGGGVKCWGSNGWGELGDGMGGDKSSPVNVVGLASGVTAIAAGMWQTCGLITGGGVKCWGSNWYGELGDGTSGERTYKNTPVDVVGLGNDVVALTAGDWYTCALTVAGQVKCWGYNDYGQLGDGTTTDRSTPVDVIMP